MNSELERRFDLIIEDLEFAKQIKSPLVLFTSDGRCVGLEENLFYIRTAQFSRPTELRSVIVYTKDIASYVKAVDRNIIGHLKDYELEFKYTPTLMSNIFGSIGLSIAPNYYESYSNSVLNNIYQVPISNSITFDINSDIGKEINDMTALDANVKIKIDPKHVMFINKRLLPIKKSDTVTIHIRDYNNGSYVSQLDIINNKCSTSTFIKYLYNIGY